MKYYAKCEKCDAIRTVDCKKKLLQLPAMCPECGDGSDYFSSYETAKKVKHTRDEEIIKIIKEQGINTKLAPYFVLKTLLRKLKPLDNWFFSQHGSRYLKKRPLSARYIGYLLLKINNPKLTAG